MSKQITVTVPDGYDEDVTHVVLVAATITKADGSPAEYGVTVMQVESNGIHDKYGNYKAEVEVEDVGCDTSLRDLMVDAARVVRTGTAVVKS